jgi:pyruvate formate lyase activating enzyme
MALPIKGIQKTSLIDYPDRLSAVLFVGGCNFRCPFCHNKELVLGPEKLPDISEEEVLEFLKSRKEWVEGVVITGGEPCLYKELPFFIEKIKKLGFSVKLDTNGTNSVMIRQLIKSGYLDYIAMDIKAPPAKYAAAAGVSGGLIDVRESVKDIMNSGLSYEFRTTVVPRIHTEEDIIEIGQWLKGAEKYVLQQFRPITTVEESYMKERPYPQEKIEQIADRLRPLIKRVEVR